MAQPRNRLELQSFLEDVLGSHEVYFQPPNTVRMTYPAIVYSLYQANGLHANNGEENYLTSLAFRCIVIDKNANSKAAQKLVNTSFAALERSYVTDNLSHFSFIIRLNYV